MPIFPIVTAKECLHALERAGFYVVRQIGSHVRLAHHQKTHLRITVPMHNKDIPTGTLKNILRQADLSLQDFLDIL